MSEHSAHGDLVIGAPATEPDIIGALCVEMDLDAIDKVFVPLGGEVGVFPPAMSSSDWLYGHIRGHLRL